MATGVFIDKAMKSAEEEVDIKIAESLAAAFGLTTCQEKGREYHGSGNGPGPWQSCLRPESSLYVDDVSMWRIVPNRTHTVRYAGGGDYSDAGKEGRE